MEFYSTVADTVADDTDNIINACLNANEMKIYHASFCFITIFIFIFWQRHFSEISQKFNFLYIYYFFSPSKSA